MTAQCTLYMYLPTYSHSLVSMSLVTMFPSAHWSSSRCWTQNIFTFKYHYQLSVWRSPCDQSDHVLRDPAPDTRQLWSPAITAHYCNQLMARFNQQTPKDPGNTSKGVFRSPELWVCPIVFVLFVFFLSVFLVAIHFSFFLTLRSLICACDVQSTNV